MDYEADEVVADDELSSIQVPMPMLTAGGTVDPTYRKDWPAARQRVILKAGTHGRALELRAEGLSYSAIQAQLAEEGTDVSPETVGAWVRKALEESVSEPTEQVRQLEHFRLERLMQATWGRAIGGHGESIDRALRIMERKARLLGLDAPAEIDIREIRVELFEVLERALTREEYQRVLQAAQEMV